MGCHLENKAPGRRVSHPRALPRASVEDEEQGTRGVSSRVSQGSASNVIQILMGHGEHLGVLRTPPERLYTNPAQSTPCLKACDVFLRVPAQLQCFQ